MEYTSLQTEAAKRHLDAVSRAKQLVVVGGIATTRRMAMDYANTFSGVANERLNTTMEPSALTLPHALKHPDELRAHRETYVIALSAANIAVYNAFHTAPASEQPLAVTGKGAPNNHKDFNGLLRASIGGLQEVPLRYRLRAMHVAQHAKTYWDLAKVAADFVTRDKAAEAQANGIPFDLADFRLERFFGHTDEERAEAAAHGVNIHVVNGVHNEPFRNGTGVAEEYLILSELCANYGAEAPAR